VNQSETSAERIASKGVKEKMMRIWCKNMSVITKQTLLNKKRKEEKRNGTEMKRMMRSKSTKMEGGNQGEGARKTRKSCIKRDDERIPCLSSIFTVRVRSRGKE